MNYIDNMINTNEVFIPQSDNSHINQSLFNIYLEIALRKAALTSLSQSSENNASLVNDSIIDPSMSVNQKRVSFNVPSVSSSSSLSYSYPEFCTLSPTSSPTSFLSRNKHSLNKINPFSKSLSTSSSKITTPKLHSNSGTTSTPITDLKLLSLINQYPSSLNTWDSIQSLVQSINQELTNTFVVPSPNIGTNSNSPYIISNSKHKNFTQKNILKEEAIEHFRQQQINRINKLNNRLKAFSQNNKRNEDKNDQKINFTNTNIEFKKNYRNNLNPNTLDRSLSLQYVNNRSMIQENNMNFDNIYSTDATVDEANNISVLEAVNDDHNNYYLNFDDYKNKLIIDIPIEINPVIEKIRSLRKKKEIQQIISKISNFCDNKLKKIASTLLLDIEVNIKNILVLAPFVLSKISCILDPTYSHDINYSSTSSKFIRSSTSLSSYSKIILALHDTWYLNGPQNIDIKVTQEICSKLLEAMSSIRRKVDRIKMSSEGHETKKFIQASYPQLISTCYFYVTLLDDLMNSIMKIDKLTSISTSNHNNYNSDLLMKRQKHPPRGESLSIQYKLAENSQKIENYLNRIEISSKKYDNNLKTINSKSNKDMSTNDILSMSYGNNSSILNNSIIRNDSVYNNSLHAKDSFNERLNNKSNHPDLYSDDYKSEEELLDNKRNKYATFINLDENENVLQKYKRENGIIEEEEEEGEEEVQNYNKNNENEAFFLSHIKKYNQEEEYVLSSNPNTPIIETAEEDYLPDNTDSRKENSKYYIKGKSSFEKDKEKANNSYLTPNDNLKVRTFDNTPEETEELVMAAVENAKIEDDFVDNDISYLDKTVTIYKNTNNSEVKVNNISKEEKKEKHKNKKLFTQESFKKKLLRYERKLIRKEIEVSEKKAVIFDDIKYFRRHHNSFNIKNLINPSDYSSDNNNINNKYAVNKGVIYLFEEGREVLGFKITSENISVVSGTIEKLLLRLVNETSYDKDYVETFIRYHQFFISSTDLMYNLIARFNVQIESEEETDSTSYNKWRKQIQTKIIYVLNHWITIQHSCFVKNALIHALFEYFISAIWSAGYKNEADRLKRNATNIILSSSKKLKNLPFNLISITPLSEEETKREISINLVSYSVLYDYDSKTIAKYLCVVDQEIFSIVTWYDIASKLSNSYKNEAFEFKSASKYKTEQEIEEDKKYQENPIDLMTKRSNLIRNWVALEICSAQNVKTRKNLIRKFIEIAKYCRELNNFNSALFIVSGLLSTPVRRLKQTWELISNKEKTVLNNLEKLLNPISNMKYYRNAIAVAKGPVVPFFPIIMKDFRFIIDGNPTFKTLPSGVELANFERYKLMNKVVKSFELYSNEKYSFTSTFLPVIQRLPSLMKRDNRALLMKEFLSDFHRNSSGSNTLSSSQQTLRISPHQAPSIPSVSDTPTLGSSEILSPTLTNNNKVVVQSNTSLFSLSHNSHHSIQNLTNSALSSLFHSHNGSSLPSNEIEDIAIYIESRLYGKGFCSPSSTSNISSPIPSVENVSSVKVPSMNNTNDNNVVTPTNENIVNSDDIINNLNIDENILTHILCSEIEIQNQQIAYDLSIACEPPASTATTLNNNTISRSNSSDSCYTPPSVKISYQKCINDTNNTNFSHAPNNNCNEDSIEASLAEKSLSFILNINTKVKNYEYSNESQMILKDMETKVESEGEVNTNLNKIIREDIDNIPSSPNNQDIIN